MAAHNELDFLLPMFPVVRSARRLKLGNHFNLTAESDNTDDEDYGWQTSEVYEEDEEDGNPPTQPAAFRTRNNEDDEGAKKKMRCIDAVCLNRKKEPFKARQNILAQSEHARKIQTLVNMAYHREGGGEPVDFDTTLALPDTRSKQQGDVQEGNSPSVTLLLVSSEKSDLTDLIHNAIASPKLSSRRIFKGDDHENKQDRANADIWATFSNTTTGSQDEVLIDSSSRALDPKNNKKKRPKEKGMCDKCLVVANKTRFSCAWCVRSPRGLWEV